MTYRTSLGKMAVPEATQAPELSRLPALKFLLQGFEFLQVLSLRVAL